MTQRLMTIVLALPVAVWSACGLGVAVAGEGSVEAITNTPQPVLAEPQDGDRIYIVGDSLTQHGVRTYGYVSLMQLAVKSAWPTRAIKIRGSGIGFNTAQNIRKRLQKDVLSKQPTVVVVEVGLNDIYLGERRPIDKEMYLFALKDIIFQIRRSGALPVLTTLTVMGERSDGSNRYDALIDEYCEAIRELGHAKGCPIIDLRPQFLAFLKRVNPDNLEWGVLTPEGDGAHLNYYGNQLLANLILEAFHVPLPDGWRQKLAEQVLAGDAEPEEKVISQ